MLTLLVRNICYLDDYLSPIGIEIGLPVVYVGLVQFFALGCSVLGQTFAHRFKSVPDWILYSGMPAIVCANVDFPEPETPVTAIYATSFITYNIGFFLTILYSATAYFPELLTGITVSN